MRPPLLVFRNGKMLVQPPCSFIFIFIYKAGNAPLLRLFRPRFICGALRGLELPSKAGC